MAHLIAAINLGSFEEFAERTSIPVREVRSGRGAGQRIVFDIPEGKWRSLEDQVNDVIPFLRRWEKELAEFASEFKPDDFWLQFVLLSRLDKVMVQNDHLPAEFIGLAERIGLSVGFSVQTIESISDF